MKEVYTHTYYTHNHSHKLGNLPAPTVSATNTITSSSLSNNKTEPVALDVNEIITKSANSPVIKNNNCKRPTKIENVSEMKNNVLILYLKIKKNQIKIKIIKR